MATCEQVSVECFKNSIHDNIGSRQQISNIIEDPEITVGGQSIKRVRSTKSLGVRFDEKLKWEQHIRFKRYCKNETSKALHVPKEKLSDV